MKERIHAIGPNEAIEQNDRAVVKSKVEQQLIKTKVDTSRLASALYG